MNLANIEIIPGGKGICPGCDAAYNSGITTTCKLMEHMIFRGVRPSASEAKKINVDLKKIKPDCPERFNG